MLNLCFLTLCNLFKMMTKGEIHNRPGKVISMLSHVPQSQYIHRSVQSWTNGQTYATCLLLLMWIMARVPSQILLLVKLVLSLVLKQGILVSLIQERMSRSVVSPSNQRNNPIMYNLHHCSIYIL